MNTVKQARQAFAATKPARQYLSNPSYKKVDVMASIGVIRMDGVQ